MNVFGENVAFEMQHAKKLYSSRSMLVNTNYKVKILHV